MRACDVVLVWMKAQREQVSRALSSVEWVCYPLLDSLVQWHAGEGLRVHRSCIV
jgi:hypothetical protein